FISLTSHLLTFSHLPRDLHTSLRYLWLPSFTLSHGWLSLIPCLPVFSPCGIENRILAIGFTHCSTDVRLVTEIRRIENPSFSLSDFVDLD
ncbi:unnamed protein product, partial [Arabidopsis halleri]